MASSRTLYQRNQKAFALATAVALHVFFLTVLAWVHPGGPADLYTPPIDISIMPLPEMGVTGAAGAGSSSGQGGEMRRLETGPVASTSRASPAPPAAEALRRLDQPTERAVGPSKPVQTVTVTAAAKPVTAPTLRPLQTVAVESPPTESVRQASTSIQRTVPVTAASRVTPPPSLRPAQALAVESEPTETVRAQAPPSIQRTAPVTAATRLGPAAPLRAAQALAVESEPTETVSAQAPSTLQRTAPVTAAARPGPAPQLKPAQGLAAASSAASPTTSDTPAPARAQAAGPPAAAGGQGAPLIARPGAGSTPGPSQAFAGAGAGRANAPGPGPGTGCEPEVLMLLTPAERERCRNQIDAANARRANQNAAAESARRVQAARGLPSLSNIPLEKRAYYDAVQAAKETVRTDFRAAEALGKGQEPGRIGLTMNDKNIDMSVGMRCGTTFGVNKGKPAKPRFGWGLGGLTCGGAPPVGAGTEEARIAPP